MKKKLLLFLGLIVLAGGIVTVAYTLQNKKAEDKFIKYETEEVRTALDNNTASIMIDASISVDSDMEVVDGMRQVTDDEFGLVWNLALPYTSNFTIEDVRFDITTDCYIISTDSEYLTIDLEVNEVYYTKLR